MKKLNFPIIREPLPDAKWLSMDDYLKFVNFNLKYTFNRKIYEKWKKMLTVKEPFVLK